MVKAKKTVAEILTANQQNILESWIKSIKHLEGNRTLELLSEKNYARTQPTLPMHS